MHALISTYAGYLHLFGPDDGGAAYYWVLPEPWSSLLTIAIGIALIVARRPLARVFAAMLGWIGLHATERFHRLAAAFLAMIGATWLIGGVFFVTVSAFDVTPASAAIRTRLARACDAQRGRVADPRQQFGARSASTRMTASTDQLADRAPPTSARTPQGCPPFTRMGGPGRRPL
jgi:hypothetical protein